MPLLFLIAIRQAGARPIVSQGTCTFPFHVYNEELRGSGPRGPSQDMITTDTPVSLICRDDRDDDDDGLGDMLDGVGEFSDHANAPFAHLNIKASGAGSFINIGTFEGVMGGEEITADITCTGQTHDFFETYSLRCVIKATPETSIGVLTIPVVHSPQEGSFSEEGYTLKITSN